MRDFVSRTVDMSKTANLILRIFQPLIFTPPNFASG